MNKTLIFLMTLGGVALATVEAVPSAGDLQQSAARQEQIRTEAKQLVARLDEFIGEYTRNGLAKGEDFEVLKSVRGVLGSLSDKEMEAVVALLNEAGTAAQPAGATGQMAKAYAGQKNISLRLKQILAAHEQQQDIDALATAVRQLADRQSANLSTAIDLRQLAAKDKSPNGQSAVAASAEAQQAEQNAIAGEVKLIADKLTQLATSSADPKCSTAAAQLGQVQPRAALAADSLGGGKIDDAVAAETAVHEQLDAIARGLAPTDQQDGLAKADAVQLADIAQEERALQETTARLNDGLKWAMAQDTPAAAEKALAAQLKQPNSGLSKALAKSGITAASPADQIRNSPEVQKFLADRAAGQKRQEQTVPPQLAALAATQAALTAKAQIVREDLQNTVKEAAVPLANALTEMNSAQVALAQSDGTQAVPDETQAAEQLEAASKLVEKSEADTAQTQPSGDKEEQLKQLQKEVQDLSAKEKASVQQGDARQTGPLAAVAADSQKNMAGKAQGLQQTAADQASASAQPIQAAADAMKNAAQAMQTGGMPNVAEAAQNSAAQNLDAASQQLAQEVAAAEQQKQELANLEKEMATLAKLIREQQEVNLNTAKTAEKLKVAQRVEAELAGQQGVVRKDTEDLRQTMSTDATVTAKAMDALGRADVAMGDAVDKLNHEGAAPAEPPEKTALAALYEAQDTLASEIQKLQQELQEQQQQETAQQVAEAEQQIQKAQQETSAAQKDMASEQNPQMQQAAAQLTQAAQTVSQAGAQAQAMPQAAQQAIRDAEQALADASAAATGAQQQQQQQQPQAQQDQAQAQAQADKAQQEMQAAQSALKQMQAGVEALTATSAEEDQAAQANSSQPPQPGEQMARNSKDGAKDQTPSDDSDAAKRGLHAARGSGHFLGLPERDRAAAQQSQTEKYPQEYGAMIEEYMQSLASDSGGK